MFDKKNKSAVVKQKKWKTILSYWYTIIIIVVIQEEKYKLEVLRTFHHIINKSKKQRFKKDLK